MARALLIGCGCHGRSAGALLAERGWAVRGTARSRAGLTAIADAGLEAAEADPDRVGSIVGLVGDVTVVAWLLAGVGPGAGALHRERLPSLLEALVDTPVRGFVYEAAPGVAGDALRDGRAAVEDAAERWRLPVAMVEAERAGGRWAESVAGATASVVGL